MSYTTVTNVAGMFPTFVRGSAQQKPSDVVIQTYIDDVAGDLDAILQKRFGEVIAQTYAGSFTAFQAAFSLDATNALEKINRYGAAAQLAGTLATFGVTSAERLGKDFDEEFEELRNRLEAIDGRTGKPLTTGLYDHLFDAQAAVQSPRPGLQGIAGGDMPRGETAKDLGMSNFFGKFDEE